MANNGQRQFVLNGNVVFERSGGAEPTLEHQETTLFIRSANPIIVQMAKPGTVAAPGISYQLSWRSTPSLNLITKAELYKKNQGLDEYFKELENVQNETAAPHKSDKKEIVDNA